jgi:peroxiredoxin
LAADPAAVAAAAEHANAKAAAAPGALAVEFRLRAAQALRPRHADLAGPIGRKAVEQLRAGADAKLSTDALEALAGIDPSLAAKLKPVPGPRPAVAPEVVAFSKRTARLRGDISDAERSQLAIALAGEIAAMPAGTLKLSMARRLANLSTEGDLGQPALRAVAKALAGAMRDAPANAEDYLQLAGMFRYEGVPAIDAGPAAEAADALLALRESLYEEVDFELTGMDGKTWSLSELRGRVVLVNFWATWCTPCRKELPDIDNLFRAYGPAGLTVLAISDEPRETVEKFRAQRNYSFPVLLDPGGAVQRAFSVEGIPKSFVFDRRGKLAAMAIDMRTERQFREMLRRAGME